MKKVLLLLILGLVNLSMVSAAYCGGEIQCQCGDNLNESQVMWYDLEDCEQGGISINSSGLTLDCNGHTIRAVQSTWWGHGISIARIYNETITINNCTISNFNEGIHLYDVGNITISNNELTDNNYSISVAHSTLTNISSNNIKNRISDSFNSSGIKSYYSDNLTIEDNTIRDAIYGLEFSGSSRNNITRNYIINNSRGIPTSQKVSKVFLPAQDQTQKVSPSIRVIRISKSKTTTSSKYS